MVWGAPHVLWLKPRTADAALKAGGLRPGTGRRPVLPAKPQPPPTTGRRPVATLPKAVQWLEAAQNPDGGWGGSPGAPSSIEETALAVHALSRSRAPIERGVAWLIEATDRGTRTAVAPIGLYFARLWYYEELYPLIYATGALIRARAALE